MTIRESENCEVLKNVTPGASVKRKQIGAWKRSPPPRETHSEANEKLLESGEFFLHRYRGVVVASARARVLLAPRSQIIYFQLF